MSNVSNANAEPQGAERRRHPRLQIAEAGVIEFDGRRQSCQVSDISVGGAMLEGDLALDAGDRIALSFAEFDGLQARIVYVGDGFCGAQFIDPAAHRGAIFRWMRGTHAARRNAAGGG